MSRRRWPSAPRSARSPALIVTFLYVPPLVTTIGVNAILFGLTYFVSTGASVQSPPMMVNFFVGRFLYVPTTVWVLLLVAGATVFVLAFTTIGRRFIAVSVNPPAAHAVGIPLKIYSILTYATAGFIYAIAAVMLSGYLVSPTVFAGCPICSAPSRRSWSAATRSAASPRAASSPP